MGGGKKGKARKAGGGAEEADLMLDPLLIRFTHARIRPQFSGCGRTLQATMDEIRDGRTACTDLPRITVMALEDGRHYCSLNNRRLYVLRWARQQGLLPGDVIGVRLKPPDTASRHAAKYSLERCSETAKLMRERPRGEGEPP